MKGAKKGRRKHKSFLPLSRSASWSEGDMIEDDETVKVDKIYKTHQMPIDKNCRKESLHFHGDER